MRNLVSVRALAWAFLALACLEAFALGLGGCAYSRPLTAVEQARAAAAERANTIEVCEVFAGHRDCKRVSRGDLNRILQGGM